MAEKKRPALGGLAVFAHLEEELLRTEKRWSEETLDHILADDFLEFGASGGVFAPALSAGASIGATFAGWLHLSAANTNLLVLAGMVGFLTGVTRTPFTSAILVLEMTDRHNVIFHLMLAGMVASLVALLVDRHSFYDHLKYQYLREIVGEEDREMTTMHEPEEPQEE